MKFRIIGRLDIKKNRLIKGIHLEGLRDVGDPLSRALNYYNQGIDELLLVDAVASLYQRNNLSTFVEKICENIFVPITVGGGIRSVSDAQRLFDAGADKVAVNTAALSRPKLLKELSEQFGVQAVVLSIQAKNISNNPTKWTAMTDNGRENSGKDVLEWIEEAVQFGVGEILLTSIDYEGTQEGFDIPLITGVRDVCSCPILASGGFSNSQDAADIYATEAQAACIASSLHYDQYTVKKIKDELKAKNIKIRAI